MRRTSTKLIKILSLGVGLAISLVLIAKVCFELSCDRCFSDIDNIYIIKCEGSHQSEKFDYDQISGAIAPAFKENIPGVREATRWTTLFSDDFLDESSNKLKCSSALADTNFFKIFDRKFLAGDPMKALKSWSGDIAVSRTFAEKLGGVSKAVGRQISNVDYPNLKLTVAGVYEDFPANCSIHFDALFPISIMGTGSTDNWMGNDRYSGFVILDKGVDPASLSRPIRQMQEKYQGIEEVEKNGLKLGYTLEKLTHYRNSQPAVRTSVLVFAAMSVLLLIISVLNYVLVAVSDVLKRSKEAGVRRCYGAERKDIYGILLRETAGNLALALVASFLLLLACRGPVESLLDVSLADMLIPQTIVVIAAVIVIVFLATALIPANMFMRIPISSAFRGYSESKRRWKLTLLALQFAICAMLVSVLLVIGSQYRKAINDDPGYQYKNLVFLRLPNLDSGKIAQVSSELRRLPDVEDVQLTVSLPIDDMSGNNVYLPGDSRELFNVADQYGSSEGFFKMMGFRLLEGTAPSGPKDVAVSRSFVDKMKQFADWSDGAVGKSIKISEHSQGDEDLFTICGVYENYRIGSAENADARPSIRFCWDNASEDISKSIYANMMQTVVVKLRNIDQTSISEVSKVFGEFIPSSLVEVKSYSGQMRLMSNGTLKMKRTFMIGAIFTLVIAIFGLIGYVRDENFRRSAEIAIRKVNGAQSGEIVKMLVLDILKIAVAAVLIGDIPAWFVSHLWLQNFSLKIALSPLYFIAGDILVVAIVVVTVIAGSLQIARMNPVDSLKRD